MHLHQGIFPHRSPWIHFWQKREAVVRNNVEEKTRKRMGMTIYGHGRRQHGNAANWFVG